MLALRSKRRHCSHWPPACATGPSGSN